MLTKPINIFSRPTTALSECNPMTGPKKKTPQKPNPLLWDASALIFYRELIKDDWKALKHEKKPDLIKYLRG